MRESSDGYSERVRLVGREGWMEGGREISRLGSRN